jgi:hypothetical protein
MRWTPSATLPVVRIAFVFAAFAVLACSNERALATRDPSPPRALTEQDATTEPIEPIEDAAPKVVVGLRAWSFHRAHLRLDVFDGAKPEETMWPKGGVLGVARVLDPNDERMDVLVRAGEGVSLDEFRDDHKSWKLSAETSVTVCGTPARRLEATRAEQNIACVITASGNHPAWLPPSLSIGIAFEHKGLPILARVTIDARTPNAYRSTAERIMRSIACD